MEGRELRVRCMHHNYSRVFVNGVSVGPYAVDGKNEERHDEGESEEHTDGLQEPLSVFCSSGATLVVRWVGTYVELAVCRQSNHRLWICALFSK